MPKMLFVMNPYAGVRKVNKFLADIIATFNHAGYEVIAYMTSGPGNGTEIVKNYAKNADIVVCAGGDGTLNETVTGLLRSGADCPIGYIPCGSTNDFAASLKLSVNPLQAAEDIICGKPVPYDIGRFNDRYFSYVASFGAFTKASYATPQNVKNALGHLAYILEGIQELPLIRTTHVRMEVDGEWIEGDYLFGAVSNSTSVGGILTLPPTHVDMCDGKFEVFLVRSPKDPTELHECVMALKNQTYNCRAITFRSASKITVYQEKETPWTLDGEKADSQQVVDIENLHRRISLIHNQEGL